MIIGVVVGIAIWMLTGWWWAVLVCYVLGLAVGLLGAYRYNKRNPDPNSLI